MLKKCFLIMLSTSLLFVSVPSFAQSKEEKLKTKVINWGLKKNVTVKLKNGEQAEGRIAEIADAYFAVQGVNAAQITTRKINFSEVHSISGKGETDMRRVTQYVALGGAVLFAVLAVVNLSKSNNRPKTIIFQ